MKQKNNSVPFVAALWTILAAVTVVPVAADACTAFVVGKKASATGYVIVGHNNDGLGPMRYALLPATDSAPALHEQGRVGGLGGGKSMALYWQAVYSDKAKVGKTTGDVLLNEHGVMMFSNSGGFMREWGGKESKMPDEPTGETVDGGVGLALRFEVVRRARSAAEGVKIATALIDRYGYGPDARTFTIADRNEAWILCAVRGRRYVARRCPDDAVMAYPNILPVGKILPGDIVSPGLEGKRDTFDFAGAYQGVRTKHAPSQRHRIAEFYRIAAGVTVDEKVLPWSVKPAHPVSADDLKRGFSSHAVGPGRESVHPEEVPGVSWPICRRATLESVVCRFAADPADTLISLAPGRPCETKYDEFRPFKDALPSYFATGAAAERLLAGRLSIEIEGAAGQAVIDLQGGRILSWKTSAGEELLFMPRRTESTGGDWSHGGISVCWPWFGKKGDKASSIHGFARNRRFELRRRDMSEGGCSSVTLGLSLAAGEEPDFPSAADLELTLRMTSRLEMVMRTKNTGDKPFSLSGGIQPYFAVSRYGAVTLRGVKESDFAAVDGMDAAFPRRGDRFALLDAGVGRELRMYASGNTGVVVWSPGNVEPHNRNLDAGDTERFIGLGPSCRTKEGVITLAPGQSHELVFHVEIGRVSERYGPPGHHPQEKVRSLECASPPLPSKGPLPPGGWEPSVRERLNALIERNRGNPDAYAVFDFDYTTAIGDLSYVCMWRLLETFDVKVDDMRTLFTEGLAPQYGEEADAICALAEKLKPFAGRDQTDRPEWREFIQRYWKFYRRIHKGIGEYRAYLWRSRLFAGYKPDELRALAKAAIGQNLAKGGMYRSRFVPTEKRGIAFPQEMKDLFRELRRAGIAVYIVSGSFQETLLVATGPDFGFDLDPSCVFGADFKKDAAGRYLPEMVEGCVKSGEKPAFIRAHIAPRHHGAEPILAAGDSPGDYTMLTEFQNLQLALLFRRNWPQQIMHDLAASGGRVIVQGRDESRGCFIQESRCIEP